MNSQEKSDIIFANKDLLGINNPFWIGLNRISDDWVWMTGDPLDWTNWADGEPDQDDHDCAHVYYYSKNFEWYDYDCSSAGIYTLCEA